jgi:hypothetical protein
VTHLGPPVLQTQTSARYARSQVCSEGFYSASAAPSSTFHGEEPVKRARLSPTRIELTPRNTPAESLIPSAAQAQRDAEPWPTSTSGDPSHRETERHRLRATQLRAHAQEPDAERLSYELAAKVVDWDQRFSDASNAINSLREETLPEHSEQIDPQLQLDLERTAH